MLERASKSKGMPTIAVGGFSIECNSFAPGQTTLTQIKSENFALGDAISRNSAGNGAELAGAMDFLETQQVTVVPTALAAASPAPPIALEAFEFIKDQIIARTPRDVDGIYLMLHGSAYARELDDPEGELLAALRAKVGVRPFIAISMDLHANYTAQMDGAVDIAVAYRTCPHVDLYETGHQAARLLVDAVTGRTNPKTFVKRIPMVTPPENHDNRYPPYGSLMELCKEVEAQGAYAASLLTVQPWLNVPDLGWKALVVAEETRLDGAEAVDRIAAKAWSHRNELMKVSAIDKATALETACANKSLTIFADLGDATNGGSYGDSTELLRELLQSPQEKRALLSITDPALVATLHASSAERMTVDICSGALGEYNAKVRCEVEILGRKEEVITYSHPAALGAIGNPGRSALIKVIKSSGEISGEILIVVHENPVRVIDPSIYLLFDLNIKGFDIVQAKSHVSFKAGFDPFTTLFVLADTLGPTTPNLRTLNFDKRTVPTLPFDEV